MTQPKKPITPKNGQQQTFLDHLRELRSRLFVVAIALLLGTLLGYTLHDQIIHALLLPLSEQKLVYLTPGGGFDFIFKVSLYFGMALTIPVAVHQAYTYLAPLMINRRRKFTLLVVTLSSVLALTGIAFGYFVALPAALQFLTGFAGDYIEANLTASSYLNFVTVYSLGLAVLFQVPLVLLLINTINGPLSPSRLLAAEPYVLLGAFILAAIITPTPDIINQSVVAGPVILMYQAGIGMVLWQNRRLGSITYEKVDTGSGITFIKPVNPSKPTY